jgi:hypothetical protein
MKLLRRHPFRMATVVVVAGGLVAALFVPTLTASSQTPGGPESFFGVTPTRVLDTRTPPVGVVSAGPVGPGETIDLPLTTTAPNRPGVPVPAGAASVLLNVTVDQDATANSFITVWPKGAARPTTSVINPKPGTVVFGSVLVPLGTGGAVSIFNLAGNVNVIVDLEGYTMASSGGGTQGPPGPPGAPGIQGPPGPAQLPSAIFNSVFGVTITQPDPVLVVATKAAVPAGTYLVETNLNGGYEGDTAAVISCRLVEGTNTLKDINGVNLTAAVNMAGLDVVVSDNVHVGGVVTLASDATVAVECTATGTIEVAGVNVGTLYLIPVGAVS